MSTYYAKLKGTQLCNTSRSAIGSNNSSQTGLSKTDYIYCIAIGMDGRDTTASAYTLQWKVSGGSFANVGATGAVKYSTGTTLTNGTALTSGNAKVTVSNMTWQNGEEVEDAVSASIDLGSDYYTELQFGISFADATSGATYEFQLYSSAQSAAISTETGSYLTCTLADIPTVTTSNCSSIGQTSATGNGNITATGGVNPTVRGFCYMTGTSGDPTTANSTAYDTDSYSTGAYTKSITGLSANSDYRVRAYATNTVGTGYGTTVQLHTEALLAGLGDISSASGTEGPLTLTQTIGLVPADITAASGVAAIAVTQVHTLATPATVTSAAGTETIAVTQAHTLSVAGVGSGSAAENVFVTQVHTLAPADVSAAKDTEPDLVLTQSTVFASGLSSFASGLSSLFGLWMGGIGGRYNPGSGVTLLIVNNIEAATGTDNVALTQIHTLAVDALSSLPDTEAISVVYHDLLTNVNGITSASDIATTAVTQVHTISGVGTVTAASTMEALLLTQVHALAVSTLSATSSIDGSLALTEGKTLSVADITAASTVATMLLSQVHSLSVNDIATVSANAAVLLTQVHSLTVNSISAASSLEGDLTAQTLNPAIALLSNILIHGSEAKICLRRT